MDGYKPFRIDVQGRREGGEALYIRGSFDCLELNDTTSGIESLWLRTWQIPWWESVTDLPTMKGQKKNSVEQFGCKGKQVGSHFGYYYLHNRTT